MNQATVGIEDLDVHCGLARISARALFDGRGLDASRFDNLMMTQRSVQLPWEDPITNAVNAARPLLESLTPESRDRIELLVTSTESGVDYSKSVASYVHKYLGLSRRCRMMEVKQACYGAAGMVQLAAGYLAGSASAGAKALVIATDVNPMDAYAQYAEPTTGHGAAAVLIGDEPKVLQLDLGNYGLHSFETMDTARPLPDFDLYHADRSLLTYLECLVGSFQDYRDHVPDADFAESFDYLVFHSPFGGMVRAAHRKMMREFCSANPARIAEDFARRVAPSLNYVRTVGNMCSGSIFLALASLIDAVPTIGGSNLGLYSYGSGCASEFFSGVVPTSATSTLAARGIGRRLEARRELSFDEYTALLPVTRAGLAPTAKRDVDLTGFDDYAPPAEGRDALLVLSSIEDYHRSYQWR